MIAPLVALSAVASITRRGFGQIPINWIILDLFGNMMTFDIFIVHEISLYLYKYKCIVFIHCASCTASRHRSRLRRQTLKINLLGIISEKNNALNLMKISGVDLTCSTLIPTPRRKRVVLFSQQWPQSYAGMD